MSLYIFHSCLLKELILFSEEVTLFTATKSQLQKNCPR